MSISLFEEIGKGGYRVSLMTTFSIDFPFYEDLLLKKMQSKGVTHHVLFADKRMCQSVINHRPPKCAGKQYSLGLMEHSQAFHPKVIMLLGKKKGLLVVGSHNVTFSGFGKNLEISNIIKFEESKNEEHLSLFVAAFYAFKTWLADYGNNTVQKNISESVIDTLKLCPWLDSKRKFSLNNNLSFLFTSKSTESLWQQFQPYKPVEPRQIIATTPFFDKQLEFTKTLLAQSNEQLILGVQPKEVVVSSQVFSLDNVKVVDSNALTDSGRYIHAKAIYFDAADNSVFVSGSANLSSTAWLNNRTSANAEAVLVRRGSEAVEVSKSLGVTELKDAKVVTQLDNRQELSNENDSSASKLVVLPVGDDEVLKIEAEAFWQEPIEIVYIDEWQAKHAIEYSRVNDRLLVEYKDITNYCLITVLSNDIEVLNIIAHKVNDIKRCCTTGSEQKIQEAWGSLNTEHPDIKLLFNCLDKLSCFNKVTQSSATTASRDNRSSETQDTDRELVVSLEAEIKRNPKTGKIRNSQGDIAYVLDVILYCLYTNINDQSNHVYGEDKLGRNEEDLIGSDDESSDVELSQKKIDEKKKISEICRKKLKMMVKRLVNLLRQNASLLSSINATLVVISILPPLEEASEKAALSSDKAYDWVTQEIYEDILNTIFEYILTEKSTPLDFSAEDESSVFASDEVNQLLSYVVWVLYKLEYAIKAMPPLSMRQVQGESRHLQNARLLFVFQRLIHDSSVEKTTIDIFERYTDKAAMLWLRTLQNEVEKLVFYDDYNFCPGYEVVSSLKAFQGYRLGTSHESIFTTIASLKPMEKPERILTEYLEIHV